MKIFAGIIVFLGFAALLPILAVYRGWAVQTLWDWFIVPLGVAHLSLVHAIGICLVVGVFKSYTKTEKDDDKTGPVVYAVLNPLFAVFFGWLVKSWM